MERPLILQRVAFGTCGGPGTLIRTYCLHLLLRLLVSYLGVPEMALDSVVLAMQARSLLERTCDLKS